REVVGLVEVELVLERALREGETRDRPRFTRAVEEPREADPREPERERDPARRPFLPAPRLDERPRGRLEPGRDRVPDRRELDPAAHEREHREDRDRRGHRERPLAVAVLEVLPDERGAPAAEDDEVHPERV